MNWIDALIATTTLLALIQGVRKGLLKGLLMILSFVVGYLLIRWIGLSAAHWLHSMLGVPETLSIIITYTATFSISYWGMSLLSRPILMGVRRSPLSIFNKLIGGLISAATVLFIYGILFDTIDHVLPRGQMSLPQLTRQEESISYHEDSRDLSRLYDPVRQTVLSITQTHLIQRTPHQPNTDTRE